MPCPDRGGAGQHVINFIMDLGFGLWREDIIYRKQHVSTNQVRKVDRKEKKETQIPLIASLVLSFFRWVADVYNRNKGKGRAIEIITRVQAAGKKQKEHTTREEAAAFVPPSSLYKLILS